MNAQLWRTVRWLVALGVCLLVVVIAVPLAIDALTASLVFGDGDDEEGEEADTPSSDGEGGDSTEPPGEAPTGPVTDGDSAPEADFVVRDGVVQQSSADSLSLRQEGDVVVAVFPLVQGDPSCVALAELEMQLEQADPTELGIYASSVHAPLVDGDEVDDPRLDGTVRALAFTDGTPGRLRWDVTDLYRAWASGDLAPAGTPFAVAITPPETAPDVTFSSAEAASSDAPALVWEGTAGCGQES